MHRVITHVSSIPQDTDILLTNKHAMIGLGYLTQAVLGTNPLVDGLACTPTSPATMTVNVAGGAIYVLEEIDATAYGSLSADTTDLIMKQGIVIAPQNFSCPAPVTSGQSVVYLIEAAYQDVDGGSTVLPYYNSANPSVPFSGPNNTGTSDFTVRQGVCNLQVKTGVAAATGTQTTPAPDAGYVGLWAITVANGQPTITSGNITVASGAPFIGTKLTGRLDSQKNLADIPNPPVALANLGGVAITAIRARLLANTTFYVSTSGNDSTGNGTIGAPWQTPQKAINYLLANIDLGNFNATILAADGTYTGGVFIGSLFTGGGTVTLQSQSGIPSNCIISTTNADAISVQNNAILQLGGFRVQTATGGTGVKAGGGSIISITGTMDYGACVGSQLLAIDNGSVITIGSNYTISGGGQSHIAANVGGEIAYTINNPAIAISNSPTYSGALAIASATGILNVAGATYSGTVPTGQRYSVTSNGEINTNCGGATYFPGTIGGTTATGGQYN